MKSTAAWFAMWVTVALALLALTACGDRARTDPGPTFDPASCSAPEIACELHCTDVTCDPASCGACGQACAAGQTCVEGGCAAPAPSDFIRWMNVGGNPGNFWFDDFVRLPDGDLIIVGKVSGFLADFGDGTIRIMEGFDEDTEPGFIARYSPVGVIRWKRLISELRSSSDSHVVAVELAPDGGIVVGGWFSRTGLFGTEERAVGPFDGFVAGMTLDGEFQWVTTLGASDFDGVTEIAVHDDGRVSLVGVFGSMPTSGVGSVRTPVRLAEGAQGMVAGLSPGGEVAWETHVGTDRTLALYMKRDDAGDLFVGGHTDDAEIDFGAGPVPSHGNADGFLASFAADGALRWGVMVGGPGDDNVSAMALHPAGGLLVGIAYAAGADFGAGPLEEEGVGVLRVEADGTITPVITYPTSIVGLTRIEVLAVGPEGDFWAGGTYRGSYDFGTGVIDAGADFLSILIAHNPAGEPIWVRELISDYGDERVGWRLQELRHEDGALWLSARVQGRPVLSSAGCSFDAGASDGLIIEIAP